MRPFVEDDFDALLSYQSDPEVARYLYWGPRRQDEVRQALEKKLVSTSIESEGDILALAAELRSTREIVCDLILRLVSSEFRLGEIGFIVPPEHQGHGYATEAGELTLRIAFEDLGLHRVIGRVEARNTASARVLEKLGMRQEAHFVENEFVKGEWQSELVYAILDRDWRASRG